MRIFQLKFYKFAIKITVNKEVKKQLSHFFKSKLHHLNFLEKKYKFLKNFKFEEINSNNIDLVLTIYNKIIPLFSEKSKEVGIRNILVDSIDDLKKNQISLKKQINNKITESNFRDKVYERAYYDIDYSSSAKLDTKALFKKNNEIDRELQHKIKEQENSYGSSYLTQDYKIKSRENSLVDFFSKNLNIFKNKKILHFAPENKVKNFFEKKINKLNLIYETTDLEMDNVDFLSDLFSIDSFGSRKNYDIIIINRVFEHLLDDSIAIKNLSKLLNNDGIIFHSVPESLIDKTNAWDVNDKSHNNHVRHYGFDYKDFFMANGFSCDPVEYILNKSFSDHLKDKTYPLRLYISKKFN